MLKERVTFKSIIKRVSIFGEKKLIDTSEHGSGV